MRDALVQGARGRPALRGDARLADSDGPVADDVNAALARRAPRRRGALGGRRGRGRGLREARAALADAEVDGVRLEEALRRAADADRFDEELASARRRAAKALLSEK